MQDAESTWCEVTAVMIDIATISLLGQTTHLLLHDTSWCKTIQTKVPSTAGFYEIFTVIKKKRSKEVMLLYTN